MYPINTLYTWHNVSCQLHLNFKRKLKTTTQRPRKALQFAEHAQIVFSGDYEQAVQARALRGFPLPTNISLIWVLPWDLKAHYLYAGNTRKKYCLGKNNKANLGKSFVLKSVSYFLNGAPCWLHALALVLAWETQVGQSTLAPELSCHCTGARKVCQPMVPPGLCQGSAHSRP